MNINKYMSAPRSYQPQELLAPPRAPRGFNIPRSYWPETDPRGAIRGAQFQKPLRAENIRSSSEELSRFR
jgi:hypothetical protein